MADLIRIFDYIKDQNGSELEPAMYLVRKHPHTKLSGANPAYCIPLSKAFLFDEDTDPLFAANEVNKVINIFDLGNLSKHEIVQLWHTIQDGLENVCSGKQR